MNEFKKRAAIIKNHRRLYLESFETKFKKNIKSIPLNYTSTENLCNLYANGLPETFDESASSGRINEERFKSLLQKIINSSEKTSVILFFYNSECIDGIEMTLPVFLSHSVELLKLDGDTVTARCANNCKEGMTIDFDNNSNPEDWGYEIFIWGDWKNKYEHLLKRKK